MKKELLAPAGDIEAGYAALYYGADAVYLGLKQFSARATASNFNEDELNEFVGFAHYLKRKVFVTINTVLQQKELSDLFKNLDICKRSCVDAVIIQDIGVARVVKKYYPELEMHASTQMAVHNKEGALALKNLGFSRVVVARELTLGEIKEIATIPDLELETFIHGALCYSYSGICQFSSFMNGRSANRGKCLYPCRSAFMKKDRYEHYFSMKDMALQEDILKLPVYSFKIEGRKKSALYVAAVTDYYRNILDGKGDIDKKAQNIKQIFSRPWCKFHFKTKDKNVTDRKFVGHRGLLIGKVEDIKGQRVAVTISHKIAKHDGIQIDIIGKEKPYGFSLQKIMVKKKFVIEAKEGDIVEICLPEKVKGLKVGADVYLASSSEVKGAYGYQKPKLGEFRQRIPIDVCVEIKENEIIADARGKRFVIEGCFEKAQNISRMNDVVKGAFAKTGETEFVLGNLDINNKEGLFVPISILNELRRGLYEQIVPDNYQMPAEYIEARKVISDAKWIIKTDDVDNLSLVDLSKVDEIIFLINENTILSEVMKLPKNKVRIALPTVCRKTKDFDPIINKLIEAGYKKWEISNYWGLSVLPLKKIDLSFDNLIYMFNLEAMQMAKEINISRVTLPIEDCLSNLYETAQAAPLPITMIVYQDVPLFTSAVCIRENSCKECSKKTEWLELEKDGVRYKALSKNCQLMLFNERVFCAAREAKDIKANFYRVDFCYKKYSTQEVKDILQSVVNFEDVLPCIKGNLLRKNEMF